MTAVTKHSFVFSEGEGADRWGASALGFFGKPIMKEEGKWSHSVVSNSATPWTVAHQAPQSMGFSRQEYWSGLPFPSPGDLSDPGIDPGLPHCRQTLYRLIREPRWEGHTNEGMGYSLGKEFGGYVLDFHPSCAFPRRGVIFVFSLDQKCNGMMGTSYPQGWIYYNESIMSNRLHSGTRDSHHSLLPGHLSTEHVTRRFWRFLLSFVCRGPTLFARCVISWTWLVPHFSCLLAVTESEPSWVSRYTLQDDWHKLLGWWRREDVVRN